MGIVVKSEGKEFRHWSMVNIDLMLDTVASTFELAGLRGSAPELFEPLGYKDVEIWIIDENKGINEKLLTGTIMNVGLSKEKKPKLDTISGFSKPGILEQCAMPKSLYPLQWNNTSMATIARDIVRAFNLTLEIDEGAVDKANEKFEKVECDEQESVKSFLSKIGQEKGITVAHNNLGDLYLYRILNVIPATSRISENDYVVSFSTQPNGQGMHSEVTVRRDGDIDQDDVEGTDFSQNLNQSYTLQSPFVKNKFLPFTRIMKKGDLGSISDYAETLLAREAVNMPVTFTKQGWDFNGRIVRAGFFLELEAPSILVRDTKFVVNSMNFNKDAKGLETLTATCILPCAYTGKLPSSSPYINV